MSDQHSEPAKHHTFYFGQEPETPVQRSLQSPLAWRCGARPQPQQSQALLKKRGGLLQAVSLNSPGCQFNSECHAVELSADAPYDRSFRIAEV